jgi:hypothetical protein
VSGGAESPSSVLHGDMLGVSREGLGQYRFGAKHNMERLREDDVNFESSG